jgi:ADP-ribosyl-[dinitrogen reductase] hydrolase
MNVELTCADRYRGCLLGLAIGDRFWTQSKEATYPLPGRYTAMALCLADSLLERGFDPRDQMDRYFRMARDGYMWDGPVWTGIEWLLPTETGKSKEGNHCSPSPDPSVVKGPTRRYFDLSEQDDPEEAMRSAVRFYERHKELVPSRQQRNKHDEGDSVARLAPITMLFRQQWGSRPAAASLRVTHPRQSSVDGCRLLHELLHRALGSAKDEIFATVAIQPPLKSQIKGVANKISGGIPIEGKPPKSPADALLVAVSAFRLTNSFLDGLHEVEKLEQYASTSDALYVQLAGAIYGQLAGAFYGASHILASQPCPTPAHNLLFSLADRLLEARLGWLNTIEGTSKGHHIISPSVRHAIVSETGNLKPMQSLAQAEKKDDCEWREGMESCAMNVMSHELGDVYDLYLAGFVRPMIRDRILRNVRLVRPTYVDGRHPWDLEERKAMSRLFHVLPEHVLQPRDNGSGWCYGHVTDSQPIDLVIQLPPETAWRDPQRRANHETKGNRRLTIWCDPTFTGPFSLAAQRSRIEMRYGHTDCGSYDTNHVVLVGQWPIFFFCLDKKVLHEVREYLTTKLGVPNSRIMPLGGGT